jgi:hypothetical protein
MFRRQRRVHVVMAEVTALDIERREVVVRPAVGGAASRTLPYDTLIVAASSAYSYFGHDEWRAVALEVKSLESALRARSRILQAFEAAEAEPDAEARARWLTFVVVGGGPTGVEVVRAFADAGHARGGEGEAGGGAAAVFGEDHRDFRVGAVFGESADQGYELLGGVGALGGGVVQRDVKFDVGAALPGFLLRTCR